MYSALKNKDNSDNLKFYFIADENISRHDLICLDILKSKSSSITILFANSSNFKLYRETTIRTELPVNAYYRLGIPWFLPKEKKAIYVDYDTIILGSLWELFNLNIDGYYLAAVEDAWKYKRARELFKFQPHMRHYNSGMMLINLEKWRKENIDIKFTEFAKKNKKIFILADQFLINTIINQNVKYLGFEWNLQLPRTEMNEPLEYDDLSAFEKAKKNPIIIHYNFKKAWDFNLCSNIYFDIWWQYARLMPFYEEILFNALDKSIKYIFNKNAMNC